MKFLIQVRVLESRQGQGNLLIEDAYEVDSQIDAHTFSQAILIAKNKIKDKWPPSENTIPIMLLVKRITVLEWL